MANEIIKLAAKKAGVRHWQIAARLSINEGSLSRKLRVELSEEERERILGIISELEQEVKK